MLNPLLRVLSLGRLTVLLFHKVPKVCHPLTPNELDLAGFERTLKTVSELFCIIPLADAMLSLRAGNLPARAACITFDDGYADWLLGVVPVLEQHKAHATFFITTGQFFGLPMWNERILHAVAAAPGAQKALVLPQSGLPALALSGGAARANAVAVLERHLKYLPLQTREKQLQALEGWAGVKVTDVPTLALSDLRTIHSKGFGIGSHTCTHPILTCCAKDSAQREIAESREQLESIVGGRVTAFAYPNGVPHTDFGAEHIAMVKRAGYSCALTTHAGSATGGTSVLQIPRFTPWGPTATRMALQMARNLRLQPQAVPETEPDLKKVLMVAFHFPPQAGSSGILRTLNFVKYLPQNGWAPTVLTASAHAHAEQRNDLMGAVPPQTRILRSFALDTARHLSISHKYPQLLAIPDRWATWWGPAVVKGLREIKRHRPQLIWSTYPIATAHLIGGTLARLSGLPWVADFRDPMVSPEYPSHKLQRAVWQRLEAYTLKNAAVCVFTTQRAATAYGQLYPEAAGKCVVIENGYDEEAFDGVQANRFGVPEGKLLLLHSGLIYPKDRNPSSFFEAVKSLIDQGQLDRSKLCIRFRAPHHGTEVRAFAEQYGLASVVDIAPPIPYSQAIAEMIGADLLIVFQGTYFNTQIPAKIYEYLRAGKPIFAVVDLSGDTALQLQQFKCVYLSDIGDTLNIKDKLTVWLHSKLDEDLLCKVASNIAQVRTYSRLTQAKKLSLILFGC